MNHIPKIVIKVVEPEHQRYSTCGDYLYDKSEDVLTVFVSKMDNWRSELAVAIHEAFEGVNCLADEIDFMDIDAFDTQFERDRIEGKVGENAEPGDDPKAPYRRAHVAATFVEREACSWMDLAWEKHEEIVNSIL